MKFKILIIIALAQYLDGSLYPFGPDNGDTNSASDQSLGPFQSSVNFPFFNSSFSTYFINQDGMISFNNDTNNITHNQFPIKDLIGVAPFWNQMEAFFGGSIFYRQVADSATLNQIGADIKNSYDSFVNFRPTWTLIVTWFEIARDTNGAPNNTFQAVITTNGRHSFAIFNYQKLEWSKSEHAGQHAQAGFNLGDGFTYYALNSSSTPQVTSIQFDSNVEKPGKWIFRVDESLVEEGGCNTQGYVSLDPYVVYFIGGEDVVVSGPCFAKQDTATVLIESNQGVECKIVDANSCVFRTPFLKKIGRMSVVLMVNGKKKFYASLYTKDQSVRPEVSGLKPYYYRNRKSNESTTVKWIYGHANDMYVIRVFGNSIEKKVLKTNLQAHTTASLNNSDLFFDNILDSVENNYLAIGIKKDTGLKMQLSNYLFIFNFIVLNGNRIENNNVTSNSTCEIWASEQKDPSFYLQGLLPCWPRLSWFAPSSFGDFVQDKVCNPSNPDGCSYLHPGSKVCYTSRSSYFFDSKRSGQQCCYDSSRNLQVGPPGGGTIDLAHIDTPIDHFVEDVKPFYWCCILSDQCDLYYEKRPSDNGTRWTPPSPGGGSGDPHFTTFDGLEYTFNGFGEYTLFEIIERNFTCQIRTSPFRINDGSDSAGTVFKAIAIKGDSDTDMVQIELDSGNNLLIFINGILSQIGDGPMNLNNVVLIKNNDTNIELIYSIGINFQILLTPLKNAFLIFSSIESKFRGKTRGLLGNFNGDIKDDFILPNDTVLNLNSEKDKDIFEQFGQKWLINNDQSVFTYQQGFQHDNFVDLDYKPKFIQDGINFSNSSLEQIAKKKCGNNKNCLYDISVTSEIEIGVLNLNFDEKIENFQKEILEVSETKTTTTTTTKSNSITSISNNCGRVYSPLRKYILFFIGIFSIFQILMNHL